MIEDARPDRIRFDAVEIDLDGHRLRVAGVEVPLEPKAYAVLALLASHPGRAFTRDEILDAVWGHAHTTPGVLNRIVTLLRQALGESAEAHRYLHTVHGVGYRFDLPDAAASMPSTSARSAMVAAAAPPASSPPGASNPGPRALRRIALWLSPLLLVVLAAGWSLRSHDRHAPVAAPAAAATMPTLVVMPLKPIGEGAGVRTLAEGLSEELIGSLAQIEGLRVIARESTLLAAAETREPAQLVPQLGITHALAGSLQQDGQALRVRLRLVDARSGETRWAREFTRDAAQVQQLQREIAESVATSLTLKLGLVTAPSKSGDAEFLRRFLAAQALISSRAVHYDAEPLVAAESEFRALLRERPDDARVHAALAQALEWHILLRPTLPATMHSEALHEAGIAQQLDPSLPLPYCVLAHGACRRGDWSACLASLQQARARGMDASFTGTYHAYTLARLGYLKQAEALTREAIARDPLNANLHFVLARLLDTQGRHAEAREHFAYGDGNANYGRWFNAVWRHDYAEAERVVAAGLIPGDIYTDKLLPGYRAATQALQEPTHWPEATAVLHQFERDTGLFNFALVLAPDAPAQAAHLIAGLDSVRRSEHSSWDLLLWGKDLAYLRRDPAFQAYLRDNGMLAYWRQHGYPAQCRPLGDGAACE